MSKNKPHSFGDVKIVGRGARLKSYKYIIFNAHSCIAFNNILRYYTYSTISVIYQCDCSKYNSIHANRIVFNRMDKGRFRRPL